MNTITIATTGVLLAIVLWVLPGKIGKIWPWERASIGDSLACERSRFWTVYVVNVYGNRSIAGKTAIPLTRPPLTMRNHLLTVNTCDSGQSVNPASNADKRRAVSILLLDKEWQKKSDRWIAAKCGVHHQMVSGVRGQLDESSSSDDPEAGAREGQDGKKRKPPAKGKGKPKADPKRKPADDDEPDGDAGLRGEPVPVAKGINL